MTYGEIKKAVLQLIGEYSIAGDVIADSYNGHADKTQTIPFLISSAVMDIRTGVRPKRAVYPVSVDGAIQTDSTIRRGGDSGAWTAVRLPKDCRRVLSGGVRQNTPRGPEPAAQYRLLGDGQIWLPPGNYLIEYEQFPPQMPANPPDAYEFPEEPDVMQAAIFYAAAHLVREDSEYDYAALMNEYEDRKQSMIPPPSAEIVPIQDVYGF